MQVWQCFVHNIFAPIAEEVVSNDEDRFLKLSVHFQISYLQNEVGDPHLFLHSDTSNSLAKSSRSFIKLSMLGDFRANVLKPRSYRLPVARARPYLWGLRIRGYACLIATQITKHSKWAASISIFPRRHFRCREGPGDEVVLNKRLGKLSSHNGKRQLHFLKTASRLLSYYLNLYNVAELSRSCICKDSVQISHFQKEGHTGARMGARSIMGSFDIFADASKVNNEQKFKYCVTLKRMKILKQKG